MNAATAEKIEGKMKPHIQQDVKLALLEQSVQHTQESILRIEKKLDRLDEKFDHISEKVSKKFEDLEKKIDKFDGRVWTNFYWVLGAFFTISSILAGLMAKGFHWFD